MTFTINRQFKDRLFISLFGRKENILDLYNAINGTDYTDSQDIEITTIENVIYMGMKNDVAFLVGAHDVNLWEEQSSYNPNMPLRGFLYLPRIIEKYIKIHGLNIYGTKRLLLPTPKFVVFYLGQADEPDESEMWLSSCFEKPEESCVDLFVRVINLHPLHNKKLYEKCRILGDYVKLIYEVKEYKERGYITDEAVDKAVDNCIRKGILKDFLTAHKSEVVGMLLTIYSEEEVKEMLRKEAREEGWNEGREEREKEMINRMLCKGQTPEMIADLCDVPLEKVLSVKNNIKTP